MKIIYLAEIVGKCGITSVKQCLPQLRLQYKPDYIIANANSATGTGGVGRQHAGYLHKLGVQCITLGDNAFLHAEIFDEASPLTYCLRPMNISKKAIGNCFKLFGQKNLVIVSLLGQFGRHRVTADNPLDAMDKAVTRFKDATIIIDYASFSTAEKQTLGRYGDGKVAAVIGSGTKVATTDHCILPGGTAYITDAGRTGSYLSSGGYAFENKIREFKTGLTEFSACAWEESQVQGIFMEIDENKKAKNMERITVKGHGTVRETNMLK